MAYTLSRYRDRMSENELKRLTRANLLAQGLTNFQIRQIPSSGVFPTGRRGRPRHEYEWAAVTRFLADRRSILEARAARKLLRQKRRPPEATTPAD